MRVLVTGRVGGVLIAGGVAVEVEMRGIGAFPTRRSSDLGGGRGGGGRAAVGGGGGDVEGEALHFAVADQVEPAELRSGERTSEVQSPRYGVCRLLLGQTGDGDGNDRVGIDLRQ